MFTVFSLLPPQSKCVHGVMAWTLLKSSAFEYVSERVHEISLISVWIRAGLVQCDVGSFILTADVQFSGEGACKYVPLLCLTLFGEISLWIYESEGNYVIVLFIIVSLPFTGLSFNFVP